MTNEELVKILQTMPPKSKVKIWCSEADTDWEIETVEYNNEHYPKIIFLVEGDD